MADPNSLFKRNNFSRPEFFKDIFLPTMSSLFLLLLTLSVPATAQQAPRQGVVSSEEPKAAQGNSETKVDDEATADLMKIFYRGMLKEDMRPVAALQAAKVEMSRHKRWHSPYYWAAFELQGEWR